jgi:hypothetical protein
VGSEVLLLTMVEVPALSINVPDLELAPNAVSVHVPAEVILPPLFLIVNVTFLDVKLVLQFTEDTEMLAGADVGVTEGTGV